MQYDQGASESAFGFSGSWREYAPIAFTNLLLTIVTLTVYSSWATTRSRQYLWSRTRFIDERLEYSGTGLELFIGKIAAFFLFVVPLGVIQIVLQSALMRGHPGLAILIVVILYLLLIYMIGLATFRALRYRLSRTWWHGIRGGSNDQGVAYGWSYFWRTMLGYIAMGLMVPWSMTRLWNERFGAMSFGSLRFRGNADWRNVFGRYLIFYFSPAVIFILLLIVGLIMAAAGYAIGGTGDSGPGGIVALAIGAFVLYLLYFVMLGFVALTYYAAFFREAADNLWLGGLRFGFTARTRDWLLLYLGNYGLVLATLGIGYIFIPYRNWAFFVRHARAYGEIALDDLTQSNTRDPGQGEGLLDAFDVGAF